MRAGAFFLLLSLAVLPACDDDDINGIGPWALGETTLAAAPGVCRPIEDGTVWCFSAGRIAVGTQAATVDLYFQPDCEGQVPEGQTRESRAQLRANCGDSPLVEILLSIRACDEGALAAALAKAIGKAPARPAPDRVVWKTGGAVIVGQVPADGATCEVNFVAPSQTARIKELLAQRK